MTRNDQVLIRRLWPDDGPAYRDHLLRLDHETRRDRFASMLSDGALADYARRAMTAKGSIFGAFINGELRGVAELRPGSDAGEPQAEAAFSVEKPFRRRGIGTSLFERLSRTARNRGIRRVQVRCLPHNRAMQGLARKVGAEVRRNGFDTEGYLTLDLPTPFSFWRETLDEAIDFSVNAFSSRRGALCAPRLR